MRFVSTKFRVMAGVGITALAVSSPALAQEAAIGAYTGAELAEIVVTGQATTYTNTAATEPMILQQTPLTSPLSMVDNLPGVSVQEGDTFGFDDWSTTVAIRGFQTNLDEQQVGITIDGLPNGGSNYGGGSKANRFIDTMNIGTVEVSQGTADIGSLSNEALGGTLNFTTGDPTTERRMRFSASIGEFDSQRYYARYDTGDLGGIRAWISATHQEATDWINGAAENERDHFALKFTTDGAVRLTGYASYDDTHENNYDNVYSAEQFELAPDTDGLTSEWTGIPYIDQVYRQVWATLAGERLCLSQGRCRADRRPDPECCGLRPQAGRTRRLGPALYGRCDGRRRRQPAERARRWNGRRRFAARPVLFRRRQRRGAQPNTRL